MGTAFDDNGLLLFPNGAYYSGNIIDSKIQGKGKLIHNKYSYEGQWQHGKPNGFG